MHLFGSEKRADEPFCLVESHELPDAPTLLVSAGIDGDEYAGIAAAFELGTKKHLFEGINYMIVPLVNIHGFRKGVGYNPSDGKYPKYEYPGRKNGTDTQRLVYAFHHRYVSCADVWIDLHGGSLTENLVPFAWGFYYGKPQLDTWTGRVFDNLTNDYTVTENAPEWVKTRRNGENRQVCYFISESGQKGSTQRTDIARHINRVEALVDVLKTPSQLQDFNPTIAKIIEIPAPKDGIWKSVGICGNTVEKGTILGSVYSFRLKEIADVIAPDNGRILWIKTGLAAVKGEILCGLVTGR